MGFLRNVADRLMAAVVRARAEEQQKVLNQELSHRMKNMLVMVQTIAMQTPKEVTEQHAVASFQERLHALSSAHDVLLQKSWAAASMREVAEAVLRESGHLERFTTSGPDVTLGPRATLSTSLLLNGLATNAAKDGALSAQTGRVAVAWHVDDAAGELALNWKESGGPPTTPPTREGFGSRLIRLGLVGTGGVVLRYPTDGFEATMRAPLKQVQARAPA